MKQFTKSNLNNRTKTVWDSAMKHLWHCVFPSIVFKYASIRQDGQSAGTGQPPTLLSPPALFPPQKSRNIDNSWINLLVCWFPFGRPPLRGTNRPWLYYNFILDLSYTALIDFLTYNTIFYVDIQHHSEFRRPSFVICN